MGKKKKSICIVMIVKNEEKIIVRCLNAVRDCCNPKYVCITDTGSTDKTISVIKEWGKKLNIETSVFHEPFRDFGYNRTVSAKLAKKTYPNAEYLVFIDADMILKGKIVSKLDKISYGIFVKSDSLQYERLTFVSNKYDWECVGVTHEYWRPINGDNNLRGLLTEVWIDDRGDGGAKADKFERDIRLLTRGLEEEPRNERYMFYLAQSYHNIGDYENAKKWYGERIKAGGWDEEQWYASYKLAVCFFEEKKYADGVDMALKSFAMRPSRIEPLYYAIKYYREDGQPKVACLLLSLWKNNTFPNDILFIETNLYGYLLEQEWSICGFYGDSVCKERGRLACKRLMENVNVPGWMKEQTERNIVFYS